MQTSRPPLVLPLLLSGCGLLALAGCANRSGYPGLGQRPIERAANAPAEPAVPVAAKADVADDDRAKALLEQATAGDAAFTRAAGADCAKIAAGLRAADGSESWVVSQQALSALQAARGAVLSAAAELDRLLIDSSNATATPIDTTALVTAEQQVSALDAAEQARFADIAAGKCGG